MGEGEVTESAGAAVEAIGAQMRVPIGFYLQSLREAGPDERAVMRRAEEGARLALSILEEKNARKDV
jgi:hypothetical protein